MNAVPAPFKPIILNPDFSALEGLSCQALELTSVAEHSPYTVTKMCLAIEPMSTKRPEQSRETEIVAAPVRFPHIEKAEKTLKSSNPHFSCFSK